MTVREQNICDVQRMATIMTAAYIKKVREDMEREVERKILAINPETKFDDMDSTEKIMLLELLEQPEEEREKERREAIPIEEILKERGINIEELQN